MISGDRRSNRPEVVEAYRSRGAEVLITSQVGAITLSIAGESLAVSTQRGDAPGAGLSSSVEWIQPAPGDVDSE